MAENTKIEWAHHTFNPWEGCTKVGPGCDNCYAETRNKRFKGNNWGPGAPRRRTSPANWKKPLKWNAEAWARGIRYRVFCASLADVFDNEVPPSWRQDLFNLIGQTPHLDWLLLTKRIGNVPDLVHGSYMPSNVWLGITVVNQKEADRDIPKLLKIPAKVRFLSVEPLLGEIDLYRGGWSLLKPPLRNGGISKDRIHWVIVGGESGTNARPMQAEWVRSLRDQCVSAGVPFLFKQWGEWAPYDRGKTDSSKLLTACMDSPCQKFGKQRAGRLLDGRE